VLKGEFWLPREPTKKWLGTLEFKSGYHGELDLQQIEGSLSDPGFQLPVLHGSLTSHYGYAVTLYNVIIVGKQRYLDRPDYDLLSCVTNHVLFGGNYGPETDPNIYGIQLQLSGLANWCDSSGFGGEAMSPTPTEFAAELSYRPKPSIEIELPRGKRLGFSTSFSGPMLFKDLKRVSLAERDFIELLFDHPISIEQVMGETLVWQTFLGLALRRASYITQIRLQMPGDPTGDFRHILFTPGSNPDANPRVLRRDVLFFRSTLGSHLESVLANWNSLYEKADKAIQLFAGVDYQVDAFYSTKLLSYLQCLEVLHRELYPEESPFPSKDIWQKTLDTLRKALPEELKPELRSELSKSLGFFGQMTLVQRLLALYDRSPTSLSQLFPDREGDMKFLKDIRNYLTHYGDSKVVDRNFFISRHALILTLKCRFFLEIALLSELGLTDTKIKEMLQGCDEYLWVKREIHRPTP
jgi:hypothetical protein